MVGREIVEMDDVVVFDVEGADVEVRQGDALFGDEGEYRDGIATGSFGMSSLVVDG